MRLQVCSFAFLGLVYSQIFLQGSLVLVRVVGELLVSLDGFAVRESREASATRKCLDGQAHVGVFCISRRLDPVERHQDELLVVLGEVLALVVHVLARRRQRCSGSCRSQVRKYGYDYGGRGIMFFLLSSAPELLRLSQS